MITGDNVHTTTMTIECGILNYPDEDIDNKDVVEGLEFRNYASKKRMARMGSIRVMAR